MDICIYSCIYICSRVYFNINKTKNLLYIVHIIYLYTQTMHSENQTKCPSCKQFLKQHQFKNHIKKCNKFDGLALKQIRRLPKNIPILQLKFMIAQLDVCRQFLEQQIFDYQKPNQLNKNNSANKNNFMSQDNYRDSTENSYSQDIVDCKRCMKKFYASFDMNSFFYVEECWHLFCIKCVKHYIEEQFVNQLGNLACPYKGCDKFISQQQIKHLVGVQKFQELQKAAIRKMMNIVQCAKCHTEYGFAPGNPRDAPSKDNNGKVLTQADKNLYAQNRFVCSRPDCKSQQCKECKAIPFHVGMTCKDYKSRAQMRKCRYCDEPLTAKNKSNIMYEALQDICNSKQCQALANDACTKILGCGHSCCGVRGQKKCLPCIRQQCCKDNLDLNGQTGDDYCNICFVQSLISSPCVRSQCGHIFHQKCLKKRYQIRWLTPRIFFNFCLCPLCKKWITTPPQCKLSPYVNKNLETFNKIQKMAFERLKFEECDKDQKLKDPKSQYYNKPKQYAMAIYAYFQCFKCKNPYFGGRKNCAQAMNQPQNAGSFKPEQLICPNCCQIPIQNCPKHGKDFIEFKCKYCCSTAQWFCWGNTHFCQPCHKKQCNGDYVSKYPIQKLPKCPGPKQCPIGGNHNGNGQERTLGCAICRNYKANSKDF